MRCVLAAAQGGHFTFDGQKYHYFSHVYNTTWTNERSVELPIILAEYRGPSGRRVLELGNVLRHYGRRGHDVVDKYEAGAGVINEDIMDFAPPSPYDLIVSISTLEHVGWDERPTDEDKAPKAAARLREMLVPGGRLTLTVPLGYNPGVDRTLLDGPSGFDSVGYLRRTSARDWRQVTRDDARGARYGAPFPNGNVVAVCRYTRP